jgi:hypothetical protein
MDLIYGMLPESVPALLCPISKNTSVVSGNTHWCIIFNFFKKMVAGRRETKSIGTIQMKRSIEYFSVIRSHGTKIIAELPQQTAT